MNAQNASVWTAYVHGIACAEPSKMDKIAHAGHV